MDRVLKIIPDHSSGRATGEQFLAGWLFRIEAALKGEYLANYPDKSLLPMKSFLTQALEFTP